jgi:hypothetical protein
MVDSDPEQRAELSNAISKHMPNAIDGGCGWHVVEQGWKVHGIGKTAVRHVGARGTNTIFPEAHEALALFLDDSRWG